MISQEADLSEALLVVVYGVQRPYRGPKMSRPVAEGISSGRDIFGPRLIFVTRSKGRNLQISIFVKILPIPTISHHRLNQILYCLAHHLEDYLIYVFI